MRRRRPVQLFSFSFLDILAAVIGVLLFILLVAVLQQSVLVPAEWDTQAVVQGPPQEPPAGGDDPPAPVEPPKPKSGAPEDTSAAGGPKPGTPEDTSAAAGPEAGAPGETRAPAEQTWVLPAATGGAIATAFHVDCRKDGLVMLGSDVTGRADQREACSTADVATAGCAFGRLLRDVNASNARGDRAVIVLWVRPDGIDSWSAAKQAAEKSGTRIGWEPADADWAF